MFNLLLLRDKLFLLKEYRLRVIIVTLALFSAAVFIGLILLVPSYVWSRIELSNLDNNLRAVKGADTTATTTLLQNTVRSARAYSDILAKDPDASIVSIVQEIVTVKGAGIDISSIEYTWLSKTSAVMRVAGKAATRDSLVAFGDALKKNPKFSAINVPLSNFVKDSNIPFSIDMNVVIGTQSQ